MRRVLLLIVLAAFATGGWLTWRQYGRLDEQFRSFDGVEQFVDVPAGTGPTAIGRQLVAAGIVRDLTTWRLAVWRSGEATGLKAGEYRFTDAMTPDEVVRKIAGGNVYVSNITFREGLTIRQMARLFEDAGFGPAASFEAAARDVGLVSDIDPEASSLEGYLFPDTYALPRRTSAAELVRRMVSRFDAVMTADLRQAAAASGLSIRETMTLASLVEKETAAPDERPLVAAVYHNRLKKRMGLQCDPTVIYALELRGSFNGNLTRANLSVDSPYNTYRYAGLPPGPIAAPGLASIEAAVRPASVDYLYFVSRNDGTHAFASSLSDHNRNVAKYQVQYFRQMPRAPAP